MANLKALGFDPEYLTEVSTVTYEFAQEAGMEMVKEISLYNAQERFPLAYRFKQTVINPSIEADKSKHVASVLAGDKLPTNDFENQLLELHSNRTLLVVSVSNLKSSK